MIRRSLKYPEIIEAAIAIALLLVMGVVVYRTLNNSVTCKNYTTGQKINFNVPNLYR